MLYRATDVLCRGVSEVQGGHHVLRFLCLYRNLPPIKVGNECAVPRCSIAVSNAANLVIQSPPFLNHNDGGPTRATSGLYVIAVNGLSIRSFEVNKLHGWESSLVSVVKNATSSP